MKGTTAFLQTMNTAKAAIAALSFRGFVVIGMKCGNYHPVITVEVPTDEKVLNSVPVIAVRNDSAKGCSYVQVARFKKCLVEWEAPEELISRFYTQPDIGGFEQADAVGGA